MANSVFVDGVAGVGASQLNALVQTCPNAAALRTFIGISNMEVSLLGTLTANDGGQGDFIWVTGAGFVDNGVTVIVPNSYTNGAWVRLNVGAGGGSVIYSGPQNLTPAQQQQARDNISVIGVATSLTVLRRNVGADGEAFDVLERSSNNDGYAGRFIWRPGDQSANVSVDTTSAIWVAPDADPTGATGCWRRDYDNLNIKWFGARGNGVFDDTAGMAACQAYQAALSGSGSLVPIYIPTGTYNYTVSPNWALSNAAIITDGDVIFHYTGTGNAVVLDAGPMAGDLVFNMTMGRIVVEGTSVAQNGVYVRSIHHSSLGFKVRGCGPTFAALRIEFSVCSTFDKFICSNNEGFVSGATPGYGIWLDERLTGETASYVVFNDAIIEGVPIGLNAVKALGCEFYGGTMEGCTTGGLTLGSGAINNKFYGIDLEANTSYDISLAGFNNVFYGVDSTTYISVSSTASGNSFFGGATQTITCSGGTLKNAFVGVTYNRASTSGFIGDVGSQNSFVSCSSPIEAQVGRTPARVVQTVGASPYTYLNTTGDIQEIILIGGTVSNLVYSRAGTGDAVTYASGTIYVLRGGDSLILTYSVAPTFIVYV